MAGADGPRRPGLYLEGYRDLRTVLRRSDRNLDLALGRAVREIGKGVRDKVREEARRFADSGDLGRSIRYSVRAKSASVYSNLAYAPVHEWGGTIRPRGVPIAIPRREFAQKGVLRSRREIDGGMERVLDTVASTWSSRV